MGFGRGLALGAASEQLERVDERRRREAAEKRLEKQEERADITFKQQQEDRAFGLPYQRKAVKRNDELADAAAELKRYEMEIARAIHDAKKTGAKQEALAAVEQGRQKIYGLIYNRYKLGDSKGAAQLFNQARDNSVQNADDIVEATDESGRRVLKIVDAEGNDLVVLDAEQAEKLYGKQPEKGRFEESERGVLDTGTGKFTPHGSGVPRDPKVDPREKELRQLVFPQWGSQLGDRFVFDGSNGKWANEHLRLAIQMMEEAGEKGLKNLAKYAEAAGEIVRAKKAREEFRGPLSTKLIGFNAEEAAQKLKELFPDGATEQELREFMSKHNVKDRRQQDQVLQLMDMGMRATPKTMPRQSGAIGQPPDKPAARPAKQAPSKLPPGVTKDQALAQAKQAWSRANPQQRAQIRERLMQWGITEKEMKAAGL
jgi:hypothetical protein